MKKFVLVAALLVIFAGHAFVEVNPALRYHAAVQSGQCIGSSFELQPGLVATSGHVVTGRRIGSSVQLFPGVQTSAVRGTLVAKSERMDLALIQVAPGVLSTPTTRRTPPGNERLQIVGVVAKKGPKAIQTATGYIVQQGLHIPQYGPVMLLQVEGATFGFSGGPVLDAKQNVVGMMVAIRNHQGRSQALVIPISDIRAEANRLLSNTNGPTD